MYLDFQLGCYYFNQVKLSIDMCSCVYITSEKEVFEEKDDEVFLRSISKYLC